VRPPSSNPQDAYDDVVTGRPLPPRTTTGGPAPEARRKLYAPSRTRQGSEPGHTHGPVVPAGSVTGQSLTLVISIMCFLACLTAGAVYMMHESADA